MKMLIRATTVAACLTAGAVCTSCGNNNSSQRFEGYANDTSATSTQDTFIRGDSDPRAQGIQGTELHDSVRVKKPAEQDSGQGKQP